MKILIVSATIMEVQPLIDSMKLEKKNDFFYSNNIRVDLLISGVGQAITTYRLTNHLCFNRYDQAIMVGICGSFGKYKVGELVEIEKEYFADLGISTDEGFLPITETKFFYDSLITNSKLVSDRITELPYVVGITVNTTTNNEDQIRRLEKLYSPNVESMEGAALFYVCKHFKIKHTQVRSISNIIGERSSFNLPLAVEKLNKFVMLFLEKL